ncbi:MAG: hypothetical protein LQ340_005932 [Diploschistes diacapsis]|nr:MAG: hypothetical protein LQ340_005932 [Diploschistes diacapsis]
MEKKADPAFSPEVPESLMLENLGYAQELKRSFSLLGMLGFSFCIVTSWSALGSVLVVGIESGGPPVMIYSWIAVSLLTLAVASSLAEICSAYPVAGGQYSWVMVLAPKSIARGMSWITGWFMITGILAMAATTSFVGANFILGMANLSYPGYAIKQWHTVLASYSVALLAALANLFGSHLLERMSKVMMVWNIASFFVVVITILACNDHKQPASFVFAEFQNLTGWGPAMAGLLGHMTEEMLFATTEAPKAIILSVVIGGLTGLVFLIAVCFCIGDFGSVASTPTGVPLIQIFFDSTSSVAGACVLAGLFAVIALATVVFLEAEGSRALYAFARDRGLPFSDTWARVRTVGGGASVPANAVMLACGAQMALNSIYFGTVEGFNTVIAISTAGFYLSYATPLLAALLHRLTRPSSSPNATLLSGPYTLGRFGAPINVIGLLFLVFASITFNFPGFAPVTAQNMNYTSAATGVIGLVSLVTWVVSGRKRFTGPKVSMGE